MACRSLEGAAFTVSLSEFLPPGGGVRDTETVGGWLEGLPLRRVLVRVYGFAESCAAEVGATRVERRVGGMATAAVSRMRMVVGRCWMGVLLARLIEGCPNAKLPSSIKLAAVAQTNLCVAPSFQVPARWIRFSPPRRPFLHRREA